MNKSSDTQSFMLLEGSEESALIMKQIYMFIIKNTLLEQVLRGSRIPPAGAIF